MLHLVSRDDLGRVRGCIQRAAHLTHGPHSGVRIGRDACACITPRRAIPFGNVVDGGAIGHGDLSVEKRNRQLL